MKTGNVIDAETVFLIVDDMPAMRLATAALLRQMGLFRNFMTSDGAEAMSLLRREKIDFILSDWNMPGKSGLDLLREIRADEQLRHLPFVMVTGEAGRDQIEEAVALKVNGFLVKPFAGAKFMDIIEKTWLGRQANGAAMPASPALRLGKPRVEAAPPSILIVDDAPDNVDLLSSLFEGEYKLRVAVNGERALAICTSETPPDLVLLDVMMPDMDGFQVARKMREHPVSEHIPVIFVTAMGEDDARMQGLELGAIDFIAKPLNPEIIRLRVRNFLQYVALRKQLQTDYDNMLEMARLQEQVERITQHDIKGQLGAVLNLANVLAAGSGITPERQLEKLRLIEQAALMALNTINMSAEVYKIETGRFKLAAEPVDVCDVLQRLIGLQQASFAHKHLSLTLDAGAAASGETPKAWGDALFCYSIFLNLLINACEAAPENSAIRVALVDSSPLKVSISNTGAVPASIRTNFFEKFVTHGKRGGTGLGTYAAKMLTEAQGGSIALHVDETADTTSIDVLLPRFFGGVGKQ